MRHFITVPNVSKWRINKMKELKILYLYPDMLELYGDYGNIQVLKYRIESRGYNAIIDRYSIGDESPNFNNYDIVFAGRWS